MSSLTDGVSVTGGILASQEKEDADNTGDDQEADGTQKTAARRGGTIVV
jgi:hypothetical protein